MLPKFTARSEARWVIVPAEALPLGETCHGVERPGLFIWQLHEEHATQLLCQQLNDLHRHMIGNGLWAQHELPVCDDVAPARGEHRGGPDVRFEARPADELPAGELCVPLQREGHLLWIINGDHMSHVLAAQLTEYARRIISRDGRWGPAAARPELAAGHPS